MTISLAQIKAAFSKKDNNSTGNNNYYPFWNIPEGDQAVIRFLPDKNTSNPLGFMVEKLQHNLIINGERKTVPCRKMYGEDCEICKVSAAFYKEGDKVNGQKYWRKKQHVAQALIIEDPLPADPTGETHQGKVRFVTLGYQLFNVIKEAFESGDLDEVPFSYTDGYNFVVKKTKQGEYSTYAVGSKFRNKPTSLTEEEIAYVEEQLVDLQTLLPADPGPDKINAMLQAALTGTTYTANKAFDEDENEEDEETSVKKPVSSKTVALTKALTASSDDEDDAPFETSKPAVKAASASSALSDTDDSDIEDEADRILARIRARRGNKA